MVVPPETLLCPLYPQQNACRSVLDLSGARSMRRRQRQQRQRRRDALVDLRCRAALTLRPRRAGLWDFQADEADEGVAQRWRVATHAALARALAP
jgi:hypothetical protein